MSKHTPGRWTAEPHPNPGFGWRIFAPEPSEYAPEGELYLVAADLHPDNAKFIVRACNSHEALMESLRRIAAMPCITALLGEGGDGSDPSCRCASCEAKAVIAKTEGRD